MVRIGFIGCHEISWFCLKKICELSLEYGDKVVIVFNLNSSEAKKHSAVVDFDLLKAEFGFDLFYVKDVSTQENIDLLKKSELDILFIIGWHRIVPQGVLDTAKIRLGIHSSLLPKDRGSSPINWQIIRGEEKGGVTLFHLTTGVDSGPILDSQTYKIQLNDNIGTAYFKATASSLSLLEKNWFSIHSQNPTTKQQDEAKATTNLRRKPIDGLIDWTLSAKQSYDWIRALARPYPGAFTYWKNKKVLLWSSKISEQHETEPGIILDSDEKIIVSTGHGCLELLELQVEGEPICNAKLFSKAYMLKKGDSFSNSPGDN